jgi:dUTP pyrophosphatase
VAVYLLNTHRKKFIDRTIISCKIIRMMELKIFRTDRTVPLPQHMSEGASGVDLYASLKEPAVLEPGEYRCIPTGIIISLPSGFEAQIRPRSGLAARHGVTVLNSPGTVDSDYRGEVRVILINHGRTAFTVRAGMRIAQLVVCSVQRVRIVELSSRGEAGSTERDSGGFGHTGV